MQSAAYVLAEIEAFKRAVEPEIRAKFAEALSEQQAQWMAKGEPMPPWATLKLLREYGAHLGVSKSDA